MALIKADDKSKKRLRDDDAENNSIPKIIKTSVLNESNITSSTNKDDAVNGVINVDLVCTVIKPVVITKGGGKGKCIHNRQRCRCKECGGSSICEHNRRRSTSKECGGGSICEHSRQRNTCK